MSDPQDERELIDGRSAGDIKQDFREHPVKSALRVVSGVDAVSRSLSGIANSKKRLASVAGLFRGGARVLRGDGGAFTVYTPFMWQWGTVERDPKTGEEYLSPAGHSRDFAEVPRDQPGVVWSRGAYFGGADFAALIGEVFDADEMREMIRGYTVRKTLFAAGGLLSLAAIAAYTVLGHPWTLANLPIAAAMMVYAIQNGIAAETLRAREITGLPAYFARRGYLAWMVR